MPAFLLATYKSIADIRDNFTPAKFRVVNNPSAYEALYRLSSIAATRVDHFVLHDASGGNAVIEFSIDANGDYVWDAIDTDGVVTNSPGYAIQVMPCCHSTWGSEWCCWLGACQAAASSVYSTTTA